MITQYARPKIVDALLTLIFTMGLHICHALFCLNGPPLLHIWIIARKRGLHYPRSKTRNCWCSVDVHFVDGATFMPFTVLPETAPITPNMNYCHKVTLRWCKMQDQKLLMLHWRSFSRWGRVRVTLVFAPKGHQYLINECLHPITTWITQDAKRSNVKAPLTLIFRMGQWLCRVLFGLSGLLLSGLWVRLSRGIGLGLSGGAAYSLLVYVSNRWIDKSIYASPIWQLHHKLTYTSFCPRIGPTTYEPGRIIFLVITNGHLAEEHDFRKRRVLMRAEYTWRLWHWHPHDDFYHHLDCEVRWVELQAMVRGDGASLVAESGLRYGHGRGWVAQGSSRGCYCSGEIGTSGCSQRLGNTTWYCAIDDPARHAAAASRIAHGDHASADTLGNASYGVQGKVEVHCLSGPGRAFRDKARGLWQCWHLCLTDRPQGEGQQSPFWTIGVECDKDFDNEDWRGGRVLPPAGCTKQWRLAVLSRIDDGQGPDSNAHTRCDCDYVGRERGHHEAWERPWTGSPTVRERKCQRQWRWNRYR